MLCNLSTEHLSIIVDDVTIVQLVGLSTIITYTIKEDLLMPLQH